MSAMARFSKKNPLPSRPYGLVVSSLKDPEWNPPESEQSKSSKPKTSFGGQGDSSGPPPPVKIPIEVQRSMAQRTKKAALAIGNRPLPQAGLLFFQHRGKVENITSAELIYNGPGGKATVALVQQ